jgi:hypothetical protein
MPPATFSSEEIRIAFYKKHNEKLKEKYHNDPEFREKINKDRVALYFKHKELGLGKFDPANAEKRKAYEQAYYQKKKAEKEEKEKEGIIELTYYQKKKKEMEEKRENGIVELTYYQKKKMEREQQKESQNAV